MRWLSVSDVTGAGCPQTGAGHAAPPTSLDGPSSSPADSAANVFQADLKGILISTGL